MREIVVVPAIRSREIALAQGSSVRRCEDVLQPLDFGNPALSVHSPTSIANQRANRTRRTIRKCVE